MATIDINLLLIVMIVGAVIAVQIRDMLSCIVAIGLVGLAQSLAFLILKAPDLAIVQLVVEILTLVVLLRATIKRGEIEAEQRRDYFSEVLAVALCVLILVFAYPVIKMLPEFGYPAMTIGKEYIAQGLEKTGAANLVSAIILDFRAYDTLGEAVVLFTAVCGALVVLRKVGRKKPGGAGAEE